MSRLGLQPINLPAGVEASMTDGVFTIKGPKGELSRAFRPEIAITINGPEVVLIPAGKTERERSNLKPLWGTYAAHLRNMVRGVTEGFTRTLLIEGIGFKAAVNGETLVLELGFSHSVKMSIPAGLKVTTEKGAIVIQGHNLEMVSQFAAAVRALKPTEPYKGKGIRYVDEVVRRKQGKKTTT